MDFHPLGGAQIEKKWSDDNDMSVKLTFNDLKWPLNDCFREYISNLLNQNLKILNENLRKFDSQKISSYKKISKILIFRPLALHKELEYEPGPSVFEQRESNHCLNE